MNDRKVLRLVSDGKPKGKSAEEANSLVEKLLAEYLLLEAQGRAIESSLQIAEANLPEWVRPGPGYLASDGRMTGKTFSWPIDLSLKPVPGYLVPARTSWKNIKDWFEREVEECPDKREEARVRYRARMRAFVARMRDQARQIERAGIPDLKAERRRNFDKQQRVIARIARGPVSANSVAVLGIIGAKEGAAVPQLLAHLRRYTTGQVAHSVDDVLRYIDGERDDLIPIAN